MTRSNDFERLFNQLNGLSVGFGDIFRDLYAPTTGYPPHNIYHVDQADTNQPGVILELAVAGFKKHEITVREYQGEVTIQALKENAGNASFDKDCPQPSNTSGYQYRGIAKRDFVKRFRIAEYYEIFDAKLEDGLLTITFIKNVPEYAKPKLIAIK